MPGARDCQMSAINTPDPEIERVLREAKIIAVVGLSSSPDRPSYEVASYLLRTGYRIIPVNPGQTEIMGLKCYPSLDMIPGHVDMADLFLRPEHIPAAVDAAIAKGVKTVWMQLGVIDNEAARKACRAGITVVMNRCTKIEHERLIGGRQ